MKKLFLDFKNKFKEGIRVSSRAKILKAGHEDVILRNYKNIDITKDFENRQRRQAINQIEQKNLTIEPKYELMSLEEIENCYLDMAAKEEEEALSDLNQKVLLTGVKKELVLNDIILFEFGEKNFEDEILHPKIKESIEKAHYNILHNLPIEKRILFEAFPHLFQNEINSLSMEERSLFPRRAFSFVIMENSGKKTPALIHENNRLAKFSLNDKSLEMSSFIHRIHVKLINDYYAFLKQAVEDWGWANAITYIEAIKNKDPENLTFIEAQIVDGFTELNQMQEELNVLIQAQTLIQRDDIFEMEYSFPISEELRSIIDERIKFINDYRTFDMVDTTIIPPLAQKQPEILDVLRSNPNFDIDELIEKDRAEYRTIINSGLPISDSTKNEKNRDVIRKVNLISEALDDYIIRPNFSNVPNSGAFALDDIEEKFNGSLPAEGRIHVDEYYKSLFMNEQDSKKYDFDFWNDYYRIKPETLRNVFNYVFFPVQDLNNPCKINRVLYFKDAEYEERRKLLSSMSSEEYKEYLDKTTERPELEEVNRLKYLDTVLAAKFPRITKNTIVHNYAEEDELNENPMLYSDVMKSINNKIYEIATSQEGQRSTLDMDPDLKKRIDIIKKMKQLEDIHELQSLSDQKFKESLEDAEEAKELEEKKEKTRLLEEVNKKI